jgi:hypothetical protein
MRHKMSGKQILLRSVIASAAAVGILLAGTASTRALDPDFWSCLGGLFIGEACVDGTPGFTTKSLSDVGGGVLPVTPTLTPTVS